MFDDRKTQHAPRTNSLALDTGDKTFDENFARKLELATNINEARHITTTPPNICTPN
jgi:Leucyl aminopeptidase